MMGAVEALTSQILSGQPRVRHGFFTRRGGVSGGIYASLNCGPGSADDPGHVAENRTRVARSLGVVGEDAGLNTLAQIHGDRVVHLREPLPAGSHPRADALVTDTPGLAIGVLAADCVPVLLADMEGTAVAAAHAGWKGALAGIVGATVDALVALGVPVERVAACVGPCIQQRSYEVGADLRRRFLDADAGNGAYFRDSERGGHFLFDLSQYVTDLVGAAGVSRLERLETDTYADEQRFFSYRRATHRGEPDYGRQVSAIVLIP